MKLQETLTRNTKKTPSNFNTQSYATKKAWEIARKISLAHNMNPVDVALNGISKPSDFFKEAMIYGWKEAKAIENGLWLYFAPKLFAIPYNKCEKIQNAIDILIDVKSSFNEKPTNLELAEVIFDARFGHESTKQKKSYIKSVLPLIYENKTLATDPISFRAIRTSVYKYDYLNV